LVLLLAALSHQEISSVLGAFLQGDHAPALAVIHQLLEGDLGAANEIISGVSVLIQDLQVQRKGVVTVTELRQGDVDQAPLGVEIVPDCLCSSNIYKTTASSWRSRNQQVWITLRPEVTVSKVLAFKS